MPAKKSNGYSSDMLMKITGLISQLSDNELDARRHAVEGLSAIGYDVLKPLTSAMIADPNSLPLRNGAHHILHHISEDGYYNLLKPLMQAIEGAIPNVEVPAAARKLQAELAKSEAEWRK